MARSVISRAWSSPAVSCLARAVPVLLLDHKSSPEAARRRAKRQNDYSEALGQGTPGESLLQCNRVMTWESTKRLKLKRLEPHQGMHARALGWTE